MSYAIGPAAVAAVLASLPLCGRTSPRGSAADCLADPLRVASSPLTLSVRRNVDHSGSRAGSLVQGAYLQTYHCTPNNPAQIFVVG